MPDVQDKFISFGVNAFFDSIIAYNFLLCLVLGKQDKFYKLKKLEHLTRLGIRDVNFVQNIYHEVVEVVSD